MDYAPTSGVNNMTNVNTGVDQLAQRLLEVQLPMASVTRIMRGILPTNAKINDESKESMQKLVSYYINRITKKAMERMERRKTVTTEDILWAMINMGLTIHAGLLAQYLSRYREYNPVSYYNVRKPNCELNVNPLAASHPNEPVPGYPYPYFPPNMLFYDPVTTTLVTSRDFEMATGNDGSPSEASTSTVMPAYPFGQLG
ncbi:nuclear transcription factor Y subunit B-2-like isoform X1 [Solanum lycopersicum]|uniref:Transcription factor CBF/NF-Y/archaeal histone domain-containing protein n=1 Tax=Solanum lycopersicum TaxID=4081 RepID=A0A3Q7ICP1_SOLLC|nr:nuclear transcription factor Y subunit B-7 isoform X1 [Solanum lycopersicum]